MTQDVPQDPPGVLIVEDGMLVRMTATDVLEKAGFQVLETENADAALAMLDACCKEVQVLFTDVNRPGSMDGIELAARVHQRWPHIRLLSSSGYVRPHPDAIPVQGVFVPKPYRADTLVRHIAEMMRGLSGP